MTGRELLKQLLELDGEKLDWPVVLTHHPEDIFGVTAIEFYHHIEIF